MSDDDGPVGEVPPASTRLRRCTCLLKFVPRLPSGHYLAIDVRDPYCPTHGDEEEP